MAALEVLAVALGLAYLLLAIGERRAAWVAGGLASGLFLVIFWHAGLPMQALLQLYYIGVAVLAWQRWGSTASDARGPDGKRGELVITRCSKNYHLAVIALWSSLTLLTLLLRGAVGDPRAWMDTWTSWGGVLATWMVAQKKLDAWIYWIIIDLGTAALYLAAQLPASSALYLVYAALAALALKEWRSNYLSVSTA